MQKRLKFANIPAEFAELTVKSFDTEIYQDAANRNMARNIKKIAIQYIMQFSDMKAKGKGLYLYGEAKGSGKTRLAVSIGNAIITRYMIAVKFITTLNLLEAIKNTWGDKSGKQGVNDMTQSQLLAEIKNVDVLILDDLGTEKPTSWVNEIFYNILNDRMTAKKITVFTSNCRIEDLQHDGRIVNRIPDIAIPIMFPGESVRTIIARRENEDILNMLLKDY